MPIWIHSACDTMMPPALARMSGITTTNQDDRPVLTGQAIARFDD